MAGTDIGILSNYLAVPTRLTNSLSLEGEGREEGERIFSKYDGGIVGMLVTRPGYFLCFRELSKDCG